MGTKSINKRQGVPGGGRVGLRARASTCFKKIRCPSKHLNLDSTLDCDVDKSPLLSLSSPNSFSVDKLANLNALIEYPESVKMSHDLGS